MNPYHIYIAIAIYIVVGTIIAILSQRGMGKGMTEYFLAGRKVGGVVAALTYSATTYSAFMTVGLAGVVYRGGIGAYGFELLFLTGLVCVVFFGPRFWLVGKKYDYLTPSDLLSDRYQSKWVAIVAAIAMCIFLIPYSAIQLMGVGYLMSGLTDGQIPYTVGLLLAVFLAIFWTWIAGMRSVAWTDSLQAVIMITAATIVTILVVTQAIGGFGKMVAILESDYPSYLAVPGHGYFNFKVFLGLSLPWFFFCITNPQVTTRLFIPESITKLRTMITIFLIFGLFYTFITITWGFTAKVLIPDLANPDLATPSVLLLPEVPLLLAILVMLGITGACISTVNSILLSLSCIVSRDVYTRISKGTVSEKSEVWVGKMAIPIIALVLFLFATLKLDLIAVLAVVSAAGMLVLLPATIGAFFWKRATAAGTISSIIVGGLVASSFQYFKYYPLGHWPGVWSLITTILVFIIVSHLITPHYQVTNNSKISVF